MGLARLPIVEIRGLPHLDTEGQRCLRLDVTNRWQAPPVVEAIDIRKPAGATIRHLVAKIEPVTQRANVGLRLGPVGTERKVSNNTLRKRGAADFVELGVRLPTRLHGQPEIDVELVLHLVLTGTRNQTVTMRALGTLRLED